MAKTNAIALNSAVRYLINKYAVETGRPPTVQNLGAELKCPAEEVERALSGLAESHAVVLHPNTSRIWLAHPFSFTPTAFWVVSSRGSWWANCAWCALGIAAIIDEDTRIVSRSGAEGDSVEVHVCDRLVKEPDLLVHFSVPMAKWWNNIHYTCGTILFFRSIREIDTWCHRHAIAKGEVLSMDQAWALAQAWYGDYLNPKWRRRTAREAEEIFDNIGLRGAFWEPGAGWK